MTVFGRTKAEGRRKSEEGREGSWLGLSFWRGIAFSGLPAKFQLHGLLEPGQRCVETSKDVIWCWVYRNGRAVSTQNFQRNEAGRV